MEGHMKTKAIPEFNQPKSRILFKVGIILLVLWVVLWIGVLFVPFLPLSLAIKAGVATTLGVVAEIFFVLGVLCTGKEFVNRYKDLLSPKNWKRK